MSSIPALSAILASGRSGSTWLGAIINSHPDVAYRFEPFHRLGNKDSKIGHYATLLKRASLPEYSLSDKDVSGIYQSLLIANPLTDKPPFFPKNEARFLGRETQQIQKSIWAIARAVPLFRGIYKSIYTPQNLPPLIFKEVTFEQQMKNILEYTSIPVVYLVRHPCGNIFSDFSGQLKGKMPTGRQQVLRQKLEKHNDLSLFDRYANHLEHLTPLEKTALLWRLDIEKGLSALNERGRGLLITYEQLCDDAHTQVQKIFQEFNLDFRSQTVEFIDALYASDESTLSSAPQRRSGDWMNSFFTVYRNPKTQKDSWKSKIPSEDRKKIEAITCDSWAFEYCAKLGQWD